MNLDDLDIDDLVTITEKHWSMPVGGIYRIVDKFPGLNDKVSAIALAGARANLPAIAPEHTWRLDPRYVAKL
jgi:hypothetical protein